MAVPDCNGLIGRGLGPMGTTALNVRVYFFCRIGGRLVEILDFDNFRELEGVFSGFGLIP